LAREIERVGLPAVLITAIPSVAFTVGANRIIRGVAIPHPVGAPSEKPAEELAIRKRLLERALKALSEPILEQTIFEE
jgi:betaine reductase